MDNTDLTIQAMLLRLSQLDGIGLQRPSDGTTPQLAAQIAGLKETMNQVTLTLEAQLNELKLLLTDLKTLLDTHLGPVQ